MKEIFDRRYPVTSFFLLVTTLVFVLMFLTSGFNYTSAATLYKFGAVYPPAIKAMPEQIWRLFSATFVHIGLQHFLVNMLLLQVLQLPSTVCLPLLLFSDMLHAIPISNNLVNPTSPSYSST